MVREFHTEHLNTPRLVADAAGSTVWKWDQQEPFGNNPADENPSGFGTFEFPLRDEGTYTDKETNLVYNLNRYRDLSAGRFIQTDPLGLNGGDFSLYALRKNSPLSFVDPTGEFVIALPAVPAIGEAFVAAAGLIGGAVFATSIQKQEPKSAVAANGPKIGSGRYYCQVRVNVYSIKDCPDCPQITYGHGYGSSPDEAWNNALTSANQGVPRGCGYRHPHGVGGSCKGRIGGKAR